METETTSTISSSETVDPLSAENDVPDDPKLDLNSATSDASDSPSSADALLSPESSEEAEDQSSSDEETGDYEEKTAEHKETSSRSKTAILSGAAIGIAALLLILLGFGCWWRRRRKPSPARASWIQTNDQSEDDDDAVSARTLDTRADADFETISGWGTHVQPSTAFSQRLSSAFPHSNVSSEMRQARGLDRTSDGPRFLTGAVKAPSIMLPARSVRMANDSPW